MSKKISKKCQNCTFSYNPKIKRRSHINYKDRPECWDSSKCPRIRHYYRHLEQNRTKQREYHRYLREKSDKCRICKSTKNLEVHHIKPQSLRGGDDSDNLMTLCNKCHRVITTYYNTLSWYDPKRSPLTRL